MKTTTCLDCGETFDFWTTGSCLLCGGNSLDECGKPPSIRLIQDIVEREGEEFVVAKLVDLNGNIRKFTQIPAISRERKKGEG